MITHPLCGGFGRAGRVVCVLFLPPYFCPCVGASDVPDVLNVCNIVKALNPYKHWASGLFVCLLVCLDCRACRYSLCRS
jgi:hypothetical protein